MGSLTLVSLLPPASLSSTLPSGFFQGTPGHCSFWFLLWEHLFPIKSLRSHFHALKTLLTPVFSEKPLKYIPSQTVPSHGLCHIGWLIFLPVSGSHKRRPLLPWSSLNPAGYSWCWMRKGMKVGPHLCLRHCVTWGWSHSPIFCMALTIPMSLFTFRTHFTPL